jgi:carbonic anhydrase
MTEMSSRDHLPARRPFVAIALAVCALSATTTFVAAAGESGAESLARLKSGNARFVTNASEALPISAPRRTQLAQGQSPFASVLSCADSRVPPEVIFHTGLGDLFVVRAAGHVSDRSVLASLEYGVEHLHTPLLVVMGHESCGAVKAAVETPSSTSLGPNLDYLLKSIRPAVARTAGQPADIRLRAAILANVEETINQLIETSSILKHLAETQQLTLVGAYYELASGKVHFSEPARVLPRPAAPASTASHQPARPAPSAAATPKAATPVTKPAPSAVKPAPTATASPARPAAASPPATAPASTTTSRPATH